MTNKRPHFPEIYMDFALRLAERSTCTRRKVGAVLVSEDYRYVYGIGYNGNYAGGKNICDSSLTGQCGCLHAEENAIINCRASRDVPKLLFTTTFPCRMCAKRVVNLGGVSVIYYRHDYRDMIPSLNVLIDTKIFSTKI